MELTFDDVVKAQKTLIRNTDIRKTPLVFSPTFSRLTGSKVYLKQEFQQKTGSFKIRGAYYKIKSLSDTEKKKGVVAASAGNHAQGVAFAASAENIPCTIVMPKAASPAKVSATKGYGATVILDGDNYDDAWNAAKKLASETGATIIHAFDDPQIIAAQGVIGLEIMEELPDVQEIYAPIGGGTIGSWHASCNKKKTPKSKKPSKKPSVKKSTKKKQSVDNIPSDGGIIIVEDDIVFDRAQDNEMRKAYLEEHRSQEASE